MLLDSSTQNFLLFLFTLAFATKIPIVPFHIWLPEVHVESPTCVSVILAAIILKIGSYGFLRLAVGICPSAVFQNQFILFNICLLSCIYASFSAVRQIDIKRIIAYSSIAHVNISTIGFISMSALGISGAYASMIAHSFSSSALFILAGILYNRFHTRLLNYYRGLTAVMPLFSTFFFIHAAKIFHFQGR